MSTKIDKQTKSSNEIYSVLPLVADVNEIDLFEIFCFGVDYGQLLMEQERQVHSEKWFNAKKKSLKQFEELMIKLKGNTKIKIR